MKKKANNRLSPFIDQLCVRWTDAILQKIEKKTEGQKKKDSCKEARPEGKVDDIQAIDLLVG